MESNRYNLTNEQLQQLYKWWDVFKNGNELVEIRVIEDKKTYSGYYKSIENLIRDVSLHMNSNVYFTVNGISEACHGRPQCEKMVQNPKNTTSDAEIVYRNWVFLDIDCKKIANVNSTDEEKEVAHQRTLQIFRFLKNEGFNEPVVVDSGNSYHLYYPCSMSSSDENNKLVKRFTMAMAMLFSDEKVDVDQKVFNLARIAKIPGSFSRKGSSISVDRPQRMCKILRVPQEIKPIPNEYFSKIANLYPDDEIRPSRENNYSTERFDLETFIQKHNIPVTGKQVVAEGTKYFLEHCLFDPQHKGKDAILFQRNNGAVSYFCYHNSCSGNDWKKVRMMYEPDAYTKKERKEDYNYYSRRRSAFEPQVAEIVGEQEDKGKKWLSMKDIKYVDVTKLPNIKTGFPMLDRKITGLMLGDLTIFSGLSGGGKTSATDIIALNAVNQGHKVAVWSGEMQDFRFQRWMLQIAAGKQYVRQQRDVDNVYYCPPNIAEKISEWMDGKFFLYNNKYGSKWEQLFNDIKEVVEQQGVELVIIDNLMCISLEMYGGSSNEKQSKFVNDLKEYAKLKNIHIMLVCHPRKEATFLRMESISGTADITNLCDNCFIIHRIGRDFVTRAEPFLGKQQLEEYGMYDSVIEVCKNRLNGVKDYLVGLYYENETRRLKSDIAENVNYGWIEEYEQKTMDLNAAENTNVIRPNENFDNIGNVTEMVFTKRELDNNMGFPF